MTDALGTYVRGRERMTARRSFVSADPITAAGDLVESLGVVGARRWVRDLDRELVVRSCPAELVIDVGRITQLVEQLIDDMKVSDDRKRSREENVTTIESIVVRTVAYLTGNGKGIG